MAIRNGAHDDDWLWSRFTLQTQWLNITLHSLIDLTTLFYLNALHPRWGVRRPSDGDGAAEPLVPASVPLLARHVETHARVPPLNSCILGAKWVPPRLHQQAGTGLNAISFLHRNRAQ